MSNITTYPGIPIVAGDDLMIISDTSVKGNPTRTVSIAQLGSYIGAAGGGAGVATINGVAGAATLVGGTNIALGVAGQDITISSTGGTGTVTSVSSSVGGNALAATVTNPTTTPAISFTWGGTNIQFINGLGNLVAISTMPGYYTGFTLAADAGANLSIVSGYTHSLITGNGLTTTNASAGVSAGSTTISLGDTSVTAATYTNPKITVDGQGRLTSAVDNFTEYVFLMAINSSGAPVITQLSNTTGATFIVTNNSTGSYEFTASSNIFGTLVVGAYSIVNPNIVAPAVGTGALPQPTIARTKASNIFAIEVYNNNTGSVAGEPMNLPITGNLPISVQLRIYSVSV